MTHVTRPNHRLRDRVGEELRAAIIEELSVRGMDDPDRLAVALGVPPLTARGLLRRRAWSIDDATWIVTALELPLTLTVTRDVSTFE